MVSSYLQLVEDRYKNLLDKDGKEFIDYAVNGAVRMQDLIKSLLEYSRVGRTDEKMQDLVSMESVVASAKENLQDQINSSGAVITCDHLPEVAGHRYQLTQLIQNLVSNAIKYRVHGQTPKIHISASQQKEAPGWLFSVQDNGIGFEQMYADKIFVIFRRLHTKEEYAGTGIGLAICKKIVERHGGRIWVESSPGKGSTFYFTLHSVAV
jgi:light-regulated signal transduction histidine kinase (bacteriophytochrome)